MRIVARLATQRLVRLDNGLPQAKAVSLAGQGANLDALRRLVQPSVNRSQL